MSSAGTTLTLTVKEFRGLSCLEKSKAIAKVLKNENIPLDLILSERYKSTGTPAICTVVRAFGLKDVPKNRFLFSRHIFRYTSEIVSLMETPVQEKTKNTMGAVGTNNLKQFRSWTPFKKSMEIAKVLKKGSIPIKLILNEGYCLTGKRAICSVLNEFGVKDGPKQRLSFLKHIFTYTSEIVNELNKVTEDASVSESKVLVKTQHICEVGSKNTDENSFEYNVVTNNAVESPSSVNNVCYSDTDSLMETPIHSVNQGTAGNNDYEKRQVSGVIVPISSTTSLRATNLDVVTNTTSHEKPVTEKRTFQCSIFLGEFKISCGTWRSIVGEAGKFLTRLYPKVIADHFFNISKGCVIQMKSTDYYKQSPDKLAKLYAYCGHNNNTTFTMTFYSSANGDVNVKVYTNSKSCYHSKKKTRELSGVQRDVVKSQLINSSPKMIRSHYVRQVDPEGVKLNNLQDVKSASVFRKLKSEALSADDLHKDPFKDLMLMKKEQSDENTRYIQLVADPFQVVIYSNEVLQLLKMAKLESTNLKKDFVVHIDATGSVVRKVEECEGKRVLYYAAVFRIGGNVIPATEYISCKHSASYIGMWLIQFRKFAIDNGMWPLFNRVVVDFSWAIIQATVYQWNCMNVKEYLNTVYAVLSDKKLEKQATVTIHICVCHFVKIIVSDVKSVTVNMRQRDRHAFKMWTLQVLCTMMNSTSYNKIKVLFEHALTVLLNTEDNSAVKYSMSMLSKECQPCESVDNSDTYQTETTEKRKDNVLYKQSPFYADVKQIENNVLNTINRHNNEGGLDDSDDCIKTESVSNPLYNMKMANLLVKKYAPYKPMWTGVLLTGGPGAVVDDRLSNGPVENWFGQVKNTILGGSKNLRPNRFVRQIRNFVLAAYKEVLLQMPKEGCSRGNAKRMKLQLDSKKHGKPSNEVCIVSDDEIELAEETWQKKTKGKQTYFESRYIQNTTQRPFKMTDEVLAKIKGKVLPNFLIEDPEYYVQLDPPTNYAVCEHKSPVDDPFGLNIDDFQVLRGTAWLNTDVITSVSYMLLQQDSTRSSAIVHDNVGTAAIVKGDKISEDTWLLKSLNINEKTEKIFFPLNLDQQHWVLAYANLKQKTFAYINSMINEECEVTVSEALHNFLKFLSEVTQTDHIILKDKWEIKHFNHPLQDDGYNCGVFMLYYIEQLMVGDRINISFDPKVHRSTIMRKLIRTSENMLNVCMPCRRKHNPCLPSKTGSESVECTSCFRWFHIHKTGCLPDDVPKDINILTKIDFNVYCRLCRLYCMVDSAINKFHV